MKKHLLSLFAMASMVFASSCTSEEIVSQSTGNEVKVTFTTELRNDVKSRAVGDDTDNVDQLIFAVYDKEGKELPELRQSTDNGIQLTSEGNMKKATINVVLVKGQTYSFAFWAQKENHLAYTFDPSSAKVSINYQAANDKAADAFFASVTDYKVTGTFEKNVTLKRPFAQINFLTTAQDLVNAAKSKFTPSQSEIVVEKAATELNVLDGTVGSNTVTATFNLADLVGHNLNDATADERIKIKNDDKYVGFTGTTFPLVNAENDAEPFIYLATAYFLPTEATTETTIDASVLVKADGKDDYNLSVTDVKAKRNFRTNIYGNLLTSNGTFYVTVDPSFADGDHDLSYEVGEEFVTFSTLAEKLNANKDNATPYNYTVDCADTDDDADNITIEIPEGTESSSLTFNLKNVDAGSTITFNDKNSSNPFKNTITLQVEDGLQVDALNVNMPSAHFVVNNGTYAAVNASTSSSTLVIGGGASVETLTVNKGNVKIEEGGELEKIQRGENNPDPITYVSYESEEDLPTVNNTGSEITYSSSNEYDNAFVEKANNSYEINSLLGLEVFRNAVNGGNTFEGKTVKLNTDIDLRNEQWMPISHSEKVFSGTFDGQGKTIKNLNIIETEAKEGKAYIGFFGYAKNATIKNVTFENVNLNIACLDIDHSQGHIAAVAGSLEGTSTIENVTVKGDIKVESTVTANGASRVAVVAGGNSYGNVTMKNVHVIANEGSYLKANNNVGALAGQLQGKSVFENCSSNIDVTGTKFFAGGIIGLAAGDQTFTNCQTTGDITITAGREGKAHDQYRVGGIAGGWADGAKNVCTLVNCSYTGNISGKNSDGSVADPLDYMGYVGRGYTLNGCQGSKVVIDGTEFIQKNNTAALAGIYTVKINGLTQVSTADELVAALEANEGVIFKNNIKIDSAAMSNAYGKTGINVKNGQTIDGNGFILNIQGAGGTWDSGINTTGGLIKNITVTGSFRGIFINHTSTHSQKVVLENVTIGGNGTVYTISCDQGQYQGIEATNCTFNGWTSFAKTAGEAKFINCSFGEGSGYKYCRPYSNTEFVNCTFCPGYAVDESRATVTFTDCTWEE